MSILRFCFLGPAATILRPLACFSTALAFLILNCEIGRAIDGNCSQSQDFMDPGVSCSSFPILWRQSAVVVSNPGILVYILHFVAANSKLGVRFPVWRLSSAIGDNIGQVGDRNVE